VKTSIDEESNEESTGVKGPCHNAKDAYEDATGSRHDADEEPADTEGPRCSVAE